MKRYLVVGATSGLGEYVLRRIADQGDEVIGVGRNEEAILRISEYSNMVVGIKSDITVEKDVNDLFDKIEKPLDGLVFCAGINTGGSVRMNKAADLIEIMKINWAAFSRVSGLFIKKDNSNNNSSIVCVSSMASLKNPPGMSAYASSKAALNCTVQVLAQEVIKRRIRVNAVLPGYLEKTMKDERLLYDESKEELRMIQPLGRIPYEQVYNAIEFLLSDKSKYITGALMEISGGQR